LLTVCTSFEQINDDDDDDDFASAVLAVVKAAHHGFSNRPKTWRLVDLRLNDPPTLGRCLRSPSASSYQAVFPVPELPT